MIVHLQYAMHISTAILTQSSGNLAPTVDSYTVGASTGIC